MSDVTDLLDRLASGQTTLDDVVRDFENRDWPSAPDDKAREAAALANDDPEPTPEGSFGEVATAYVLGQIDDQQYAALAQAAAKAMGGGGGLQDQPDVPPADTPSTDAATPQRPAAPAPQTG